MFDLVGNYDVFYLYLYRVSLEIINNVMVLHKSRLFCATLMERLYMLDGFTKKKLRDPSNKKIEICSSNHANLKVDKHRSLYTGQIPKFPPSKNPNLFCWPEIWPHAVWKVVNTWTSR